ncbi:MAG: hypothetical protein JSR21_11410 [Proteobacteria bacterium]|nr:hypothetical protein [Pseudomonadota bacterium]
MAWSNVGPIVFLEPGQSVTWSYWFSGNADKGLQIAGPFHHPAPGLLGTVVASNQGIQTNGFNNVVYVVTTTETDGREGAAINLQGGGVT